MILATPASGCATRPDSIMKAIRLPVSIASGEFSAIPTPISSTPRLMNPSIGVIRVCGQLAIRIELSLRWVESAVRLSHSSRCCGSSASDLTVRMPWIDSISTLLFCVSAWM